MSLRQEKEKGVNVQVLLRCRPFSDDELRSNAPQVVTCNDFQREVAISQSIAGKHVDRIFTFDKVFGPSAQQRDLYEQAVIPIVNEVLEGFNCTIFAYGQTGTGKTYTMEGECKKAKSGPNGELPSEAGVIPRAVKQIFDTLESQNAEYSVKVTFLELYNEEITDLLAPDELPRVPVDDKQKKQLPLMEDGKGGVLVRGLEEEIVNSASEIFSLLEKGSSKRRTAETLLNKQSSRSHSLFSITIHIKEPTPEGEELIKCGKLNLVDLAGSENISRSGAREGRAREAGEINKSLLTLGRVINALVEHLGHIPYRDSKLTRLLRDSLGGRTKTCIIATVSPAVHCLEETLSTLDYAHRAKHIKNKPEVNQKMMKSTLIKDLYCEIERLKGEVYAAREKNGIYIPKERYLQEENERKAMSDQVDQLSTCVETYQKQLEESQVRCNSQVKKIASLINRLDGTEKNLNETKKNMERTEEELRRCHYTLKEKDYVISEQIKSENRLVHQASVLRSDLEKCLKDNALLFSKLAREDKLNAENRSVVTDFQSELSQQIGGLCSKVSVSAARQNENLRYIEKQCDSFLNSHEKAVGDLRKKVSTSRALLLSHVEDIQNVARLHKASFDAGLDEISSTASSNSFFIEEFLASESKNADAIFGSLQHLLSGHQGEMAIFSRELRQRFHSSVEQTREVSEYMNEIFRKILEESGKLENHCCETKNDCTANIIEFQKAYEEQTKSDTEKFISEITSLASNLASSYSRRQQELVDKRLVGLREAFIGKMTFFDEHVSSVTTVTSDAKRKWNEFSKQTETNVNDGVDFSASKHCKMELLFRDCTTTLERAQDQCKTTHGCLKEMSGRHVKAMSSLVRNALESNEEHEAEVASACINVEEGVKKSNNDIFHHFDGISANTKESVSGILQGVKEDDTAFEALRVYHSNEAASIMETALDTFCNRYMDYEPSGATPGRCEKKEDERVPSEESIEMLRAKSIEHLVDEFRENNLSFHVSVVPKESNQVLLNRPPLTEVNN